MATKPRHLARKGRPGGNPLWYWSPSASLRRLGYRDRRLDDDEARARRQCEELNKEADAYRSKVARGLFDPGPAGSVHALIAMYKAHEDFTELREPTQRSYRQCLDIIGADIGDARAKAITPPVVQAIKRRYKGTPWKANAILRTLRLLFSFGIREGMLSPPNPAANPRTVRTSPRRAIWTREDERRFLKVASPEIALAWMVSLWTAQRQTDVLLLPWSAYDGEAISLTQSKRGATLEIWCATPLREALDNTPRRSPIICTDTRGRPWKADNFRSQWIKTARRAGVTGLQYRDLRRTAVVRLAEAGCSVPQIASITGHSFKHVHEILEVYLPRTRALSRSAVTVLDGVGNKSETSETGGLSA